MAGVAILCVSTYEMTLMVASNVGLCLVGDFLHCYAAGPSGSRIIVNEDGGVSISARSQLKRFRKGSEISVIAVSRIDDDNPTVPTVRDAPFLDHLIWNLAICT